MVFRRLFAGWLIALATLARSLALMLERAAAEPSTALATLPPDPVMAALAERYPGAPAHWLAHVAERTSRMMDSGETPTLMSSNAEDLAAFLASPGGSAQEASVQAAQKPPSRVAGRPIFRRDAAIPSMAILGDRSSEIWRRPEAQRRRSRPVFAPVNETGRRGVVAPSPVETHAAVPDAPPSKPTDPNRSRLATPSRPETALEAEASRREAIGALDASGDFAEPPFARKRDFQSRRIQPDLALGTAVEHPHAVSDETSPSRRDATIHLERIHPQRRGGHRSIVRTFLAARLKSAQIAPAANAPKRVVAPTFQASMASNGAVPHEPSTAHDARDLAEPVFALEGMSAPKAVHWTTPQALVGERIAMSGSEAKIRIVHPDLARRRAASRAETTKAALAMDEGPWPSLPARTPTPPQTAPLPAPRLEQLSREQEGGLWSA